MRTIIAAFVVAGIASAVLATGVQGPTLAGGSAVAGPKPPTTALFDSAGPASTAAAHPPAAGPPLDAGRRGVRLLAEARAACGGAAWDNLAGWHERGRVAAGGRASGTYEAWSAITGLGMAVRNEGGGAVTGYAGFDGATYWRVRPTGGVDAGSVPATVRLRARDAYLSNFGYFLPGRFPASVFDAGAKTLGRAAFDVVAVTPRGAEGFELWIDHASHRVARIVIAGQVAELSGYRIFAGVCAPTMLVQSDSNPAHTTTLNVDSVETAALPAAVFAVP